MFAKTKALLFVLVLAAFLALAGCQQAQGDGVEIKDVWARPGIAGGNTAVYFNLENPTAESEMLMSAASDAAETVQLHMSRMEASGMMSMHEQESVEIPAGETVAFKPGGLHVMMIGLKNDLAAGDTIEVTLNFHNAGSITLEVPVQEP